MTPQQDTEFAPFAVRIRDSVGRQGFMVHVGAELSELARGSGAEPEYPLPWAATPATSFLSTPEDTRRGLESTGFEVQECLDHTAKNEAYAAKARATLKAGGKHPHRAIPLIHGDNARTVMTNSARGVSEGRLIPIEIFARRRG